MNDALRDIIENLSGRAATQTRDMGTHSFDAAIYALFVGWGDALNEVADQVGWDDSYRERLRAARRELVVIMGWDECLECGDHFGECKCPTGVRPEPAMPLAQQLATIAPYLGTAAEQILPQDADRERIVRLAITRFASIGAAEHGDALFHRDAAELIEEEEAEFADAIIYRARRLSLASASPIRAARIDVTLGVDPRPMRSAMQAAREEFSRQLMHEIVHGSRPAGYDKGNSAEALHPPQGDA